MALTKETIVDKTEVLGIYKAVQCRQAIVIKEDGTEISRSFHRYTLHPSGCVANLDSDGNPDGSFTHTDTDISAETAETQAICNGVWTDAVRAAWKTHEESQKG